MDKQQQILQQIDQLTRAVYAANDIANALRAQLGGSLQQSQQSNPMALTSQPTSVAQSQIKTRFKVALWEKTNCYRGVLDTEVDGVAMKHDIVLFPSDPNPNNLVMNGYIVPPNSDSLADASIAGAFVNNTQQGFVLTLAFHDSDGINPMQAQITLAANNSTNERAPKIKGSADVAGSLLKPQALAVLKNAQQQQAPMQQMQQPAQPADAGIGAGMSFGAPQATVGSVLNQQQQQPQTNNLFGSSMGIPQQPAQQQSDPFSFPPL